MSLGSWLNQPLIIQIVQEEDGDDGSSEEAAVLGFWTGFIWLVVMTVVIAILSEYVVGTIEVKKRNSLFEKY